MSAVQRELKKAFESIDFQSGVLHSELTIELTNIRRGFNKGIAKKFDASNIPAIIKKHTNVAVTVECEEQPYANACVFPPAIDMNHPLINDWIVGWIDHKDGLKALYAAKEPLKASVDLKNSKVHGYFAQIVCPIYVTTGLLLDSTITDAEISAIILHEVGHIFSYFEYVGFTYRTNRIMACTVRAFFECDTASDRDIVLKAYEEVSGTALKNKHGLLNAKSTEVVTTVLLKDFIEKKRNEVGTGVYDQRSFEILADDFASRQGASRDLVTGLQKLFLHAGSSDTIRGFWGGLLYILELVSAAAFFFVFLLGPLAAPILYVYTIPMLLLVFLSTDPNSKIYDDFKDRIGNIRRQLVETLKDDSLPKSRKKRALEDLEVVKKVEEESLKRPGFFQVLWFAFGSRRKASTEIDVQKQLEELAANDLFVAANKLQFGV